MKKEDVTHKGVITGITANVLTIRTEDECRCDGCAVMALCNKDSSDSHETRSINVGDTSRYSVGERVEVTASPSSTLLATWWALVLPTLVFIGVILGVRFGWPESGAWSILAGFVALGVYDLFLYLFRKRIASRVVWKVRPM